MLYNRTKIMVTMALIALFTPILIVQFGGIQSTTNAAGGDEAAGNVKQAETGVLPAATARVEGEESPLSFNTGDSLARRLNTQEMVDEIGAAAFELRDQTLEAIEVKIAYTRAAVVEVAVAGQVLGGEVRDQVQASIARMDEAQEELRQTMENANAAGREEWVRLRSKLAANFEAFAKAAVNANASVNEARSGIVPLFPRG
jgi:DNA-binding transcriptional regulator YdaS (Cro superfamily)